MMQNKTNKLLGDKTKSPWYYFRIFWLLILVGFVSIFLIFYGVANFNLLGKMPDLSELENPDINVSSEIYSSDGVLLDRFELERRIPVEYNELPQHLVDALVSKEDERYTEHSGIDPTATLRIIFKAGTSGGGSTITQQLAKLLFSGKPKNTFERILQKLKEWVVAVELERLYTKEEIIELYLNKFDFVYNASGIEAASRTYFNKTVSKLTRPEAAMLVAMLNNPNRFNPKSKPANAYLARNRVLKKMYENGKIPNEEEFVRDTIDSVRLDFKLLKSTSKYDYSSGYFKYSLRKEIDKYLKDIEAKTGKTYSLSGDGLKIYLSIDSRMQKMAIGAMRVHLKDLQKVFWREHKNRKSAPFYNLSDTSIDRIMVNAMRRTNRYKSLEEKGKSHEEIRKIFDEPTQIKMFTWEGIKDTIMSPWDSIRYHKHILHSGLLSMDPQSGQIKAWVGGINWNHFKYDHVQVGKRQVGSTFKPILYATAIDQLGLTPCYEESNREFNLGGWNPKNSGNRYSDKISLRKALANSLNVVAARLITQVKPANVINTARRLGITSPMEDDLTIALGSSDISLYEMVGAYSTFANKGLYIKPQLVMKIEDKNGKIIKEYEPISEEVFDENVSYTMIDLMRGVCKFGTARRIAREFPNVDIVGKTGTTNDNSDGWFIGATPNLVTGIWVGAEDRAAHFVSTAYGQGAYMALPMWVNFMKDVYKYSYMFNVKKTDVFKASDGITQGWSCESDFGSNSDGVGTIDDIKMWERNKREAALRATENATGNGGLNKQDSVNFEF